VIDDGFAWLQG